MKSCLEPGPHHDQRVNRPLLTERRGRREEFQQTHNTETMENAYFIFVK